MIICECCGQEDTRHFICEDCGQTVSVDEGGDDDERCSDCWYRNQCGPYAHRCALIVARQKG